MRRIIKGVLLSVFLVLGIGLGPLVMSVPASATTGGCSGAGCNGQDPSGKCDDGVTVAAMAVKDGMLELRYSSSCNRIGVDTRHTGGRLMGTALPISVSTLG